MSTPVLSNLINDLSDDISDAKVFWQIGTVLCCFLLAWLLTRYLRRNFFKEDVSGETSALRSFSRVVFPAVSLLLIFLAKLLLQKWQHVHLLKLLLPILGSLTLIRFAYYVLRRIFSKDGTIGSFLAFFERVFAILVLFGVVIYFTGLWLDLITLLDDTVLPFGRNKISILEILQAISSVIVTLIFALWASTALETRLMLLPNVHTSFKVVLSRLGRGILILLAILASLTLVGIDLTVLSVFGGALGVGLGLGLQKIASSYVSGFIILLDRSVSIGDMISVEKFNGIITHINTRYTVLKGFDGGESIIPNEMLVSHPVQNFSLTDRSIVLTSDFTVAYKTDLAELLPALVQAVSVVARVSAIHEPSALLLKFGSDGLDLRVCFWIDDPENGRSNVLSEVNLSIWNVIQSRQIELPFPQRVITLLGGSDKILES